MLAMASFRWDRGSSGLLGLLLVSSVISAIIGLLVEKEAETVFRAQLVTTISMAMRRLMLWI
jgi:hypothetical protein